MDGEVVAAGLCRLNNSYQKQVRGWQCQILAAKDYISIE